MNRLDHHGPQIAPTDPAVFRHDVDPAGIGSGDSVTTTVRVYGLEPAIPGNRDAIAAALSTAGDLEVSVLVAVHNDMDRDGNYVQHWDAESLRTVAATLNRAAVIVDAVDRFNMARAYFAGQVADVAGDLTREANR